MHPLTGKKDVVTAILDRTAKDLASNSAEARAAIAKAYGISDLAQIESVRARLASDIKQRHQLAKDEVSHRDVHYVSRIDPVGIFQSVLEKIFNEIPDLQGYGNKNPSWLATLIEKGIYDVTTCCKHIFEDVHGNHRPLLSSILSELKQLNSERAPYPAGTPERIQLPDTVTIALLGDWGGDNAAARNVARVVAQHAPDLGIHLGDIYYGGTKQECESFLALWPFHENPADYRSPIRKGTSFALNGNHEMYTGGEAYFSTVLPAFCQPQPFFCLETKWWRIIGLDTAYAGGLLRGTGTDNSMNAQWSWLVDLLRRQYKKNILLTHHQPVSAHTQEWNDSEILRQQVDELFSITGIGEEAIFGWFFGHEHRCAIYDDHATRYNARLIGNGCIPHEVQTEKEADRGCTPVAHFNRRETRVEYCSLDVCEINDRGLRNHHSVCG